MRSFVNSLHRAVPLFFLVLLVLAMQVHIARAENWPSWRGANGSGVATVDRLPLSWDGETNIRWSVELPEPGNSTPVVWEDRIFLTQPLLEEQRRLLICFDRKTGQELWQRHVEWTEKERTHNTNYLCSASPVTDGRFIVVWYGSAGLHCYDLEGNEVWNRDLGLQTHDWGYAASPVIYGKTVILNFGPGNREFVAAFELATGKTIWQVDEPPPEAEGDLISRGAAGPDRADPSKERADLLRGSWSTPLVIKAADRDELILTLPGRVEARDPASGRELWRCGGLGALVYTSPVHGEGVVVALGGYHSPGMAVRTGGNGDVTETHRLWHKPKTELRLGTGIIHEGKFFVPNMQGVAQCFDLKTGELVWQKRLAGSGGNNANWGSYLRSGDRIYSLNQSGDAYVFRAADRFEQLAMNRLDQRTNSSVAVSGGDLLIRTHESLWCVGNNTVSSRAVSPPK